MVKARIEMPIADMSPVVLFINAGFIARIVMIVLVVASVVTWILIIDGVYVSRRIGKALKSARAGKANGILWPFNRVAKNSVNWRLKGERPSERRGRISRQMRSAVNKYMIEAKGRLDNLAIVSSVSPFVGLFGTVCGIISSFASIAETQDTSLAVVAPGITEALASTAYGLAAAIPASIGYNRIGYTFRNLSLELTSYAEHDLINEAVL